MRHIAHGDKDIWTPGSGIARPSAHFKPSSAAAATLLETLSLDSNPTFGFSFDDEIVDFSGNETGHTSNFASGYTTGPTSASAINSDLTADVIDITSANPTVFTVEAVFKMPATASNQIVISSDSGGGSTRPWKIKILANGDFQAFANSQLGPVLTSTGTALDDGAWHHVILTHSWTTGVTNHWVDGVNVGDDLSGSTSKQTHTQITACANDNNSDPMTGDLDFIAMYPTILADGVIATHHTASGV